MGRWEVFCMRIPDEVSIITEVIKKTVPCEKIYLYGSYAYGAPKEDSDLDFFVVLPDDSVRPMEAVRMIYRNLSGVRRTKDVDVVAARAGRFASMSALPTMERQVAREGVMLYEREGTGMRMA